MQLTRVAVHRPVVALTIALALTLFGMVSYFSLGLENNPELKLPIVTITATYPGASAQTVEEQVTLRQIATLQHEQKPTTITRVNRQRVATLGADPLNVPLGTATADAPEALNRLERPPGMCWALAGTSDEQQTSFTSMILGLGASIVLMYIVLMYLVLTVLYESWLQPLLILTALPLASVGAFLGLLVFGQTISVVSFIGLIALFVLVGKNAILLVDRANDLRREGLTREQALEQAGPSRLRPILMTSAVLILSMLPVAISLGGDGSGRAPLGAVLVGGMATSTFLSLLYVPMAYTYFDSLAKLPGRLLGWRLRWPSRRKGAPAIVRSGRRCRCQSPAARTSPTTRGRPFGGLAGDDRTAHAWRRSAPSEPGQATSDTHARSWTPASEPRSRRYNDGACCRLSDPLRTQRQTPQRKHGCATGFPTAR